jgi:hypothetical protein
MERGAKVFIILLMLVGSSSVSLAQHEGGERQFEINMVWGHAQSSFEDNLSRPMPGIVFSLGGRTPDLPLVLSSEIGWMSYGFDNFLELQFPSTTNTVLPPSVVNVNTKNSILLTHLVARVIPFEGVIAPYVEGLVGFKFISTNIGIESEILYNEDSDIIINDDDRILTSSQNKSIALSYGVGAGINIQIFEGKLGFHNAKSTIFLHVGAQYLFGSKADYLTEKSIQPIANTVTFEKVESETDMLIPKFGFRLGM